eukprot:3667385-Pyramimonas_sp.AAC.1
MVSAILGSRPGLPAPGSGRPVVQSARQQPSPRTMPRRSCKDTTATIAHLQRRDVAGASVLLSAALTFA